MASMFNTSISAPSSELPWLAATAESSSVNESSHAEDAAPTYLDWTQRPPELQQCVSDAFLRLSRQEGSHWGLYNGIAEYGICGVKEHNLMKKIIQKAPHTQKDFYAIDIGAGNFEWGDELATFINAQADLPEGIKIHIIGIRGEQFTGDRLVQTGRCNIYKLGCFKIEELEAEFQEHGLNLSNQVDLIISHWAFRHFVDPTGTLLQALNLLRCKGFLLVDGFFFLTQDQQLKQKHKVYNENMTRLFLDTKEPFLTRAQPVARSLDQFVLQRQSETPYRLSMSYQNLIQGVEGKTIGSHCITQLMRNPKPHDNEPWFDYDPNHLSGNKALYEQLRQNDLIYDTSTPWDPILEADAEQINPSLHKAAAAGDKHAVIASLEKGDDVNESGPNACTALHLAIQVRDEEIFQLLLEQKPNLDLLDEEGSTPLHIAAMVDTDGRFLQPLLDAGAKIDGSGEWRNPLYRAIEAKNVAAALLLIQAGAKASDEQRAKLADFQK